VFRVSSTMFIGAFVTLVIGTLLLGLSFWLQPVAETERAMAGSDAAMSLQRYEVARQRFDWFPVTKRVMPELYDLISANELSLLYELQRYDDIIERTSVDGGGGAGAFWAGCAMFVKALLEDKPEARMGWIAQSHQQFRRALEFASGDWDSKFNYELTGKLVGGLKKQPDTPKQDMMKLLRDAQRTRTPQVRKVG
jgi:hypothetical protein